MQITTFTSVIDDVIFIGQINIFSIDDYQNKGKWIGNQSCSDDPKELFESIVFKLEDFVESYKYKYFDNIIEEYSESRPKLPNKLWSATDNRDYGRCFTTIPTSDHIQYGIKSISLFLRMKNADIYIHTPENFVTAKENTESLYWHDAHLGKILVFSVKKLQQHDTETPLVRSVMVLCHT